MDEDALLIEQSDRALSARTVGLDAARAIVWVVALR
jgi:hypothetical protein